MSILFSSLFSSGGGGGVFVPSSSIGFGLEIAAGQAAGTILTITPPAGERVRLTGLFGVANVASIAIVVGGTQIITGNLFNSIATNQYCVGISGGNNIANTQAVATIPNVFGGTDEVITIVNSGVNTASVIIYSYEFGVLK